MCHGIVTACSRLILVLAATAIAGCSIENDLSQGPAAGRDDILSDARTGDQDTLRVKADTARNRLWVLGLPNVRVYDTVTRRLIRQISLPGWSVIRAVCDPDLVLDRSGSALVSSNLQTKLWRIDGDSFEVKAQEIRLTGRENWDVGFGALAFIPSGDLYALASTTRSLWKIDLGKGSASMIERFHPPMNTCVLKPQFLNSFERSRKLSMNPSPQQN